MSDYTGCNPQQIGRDKDERITDLTAVLKLIDDDIRHHLRGDDIAPALVRTHAIKALRDVLRGAKGQWANIVSDLRKELSAKDERIAELEKQIKHLNNTIERAEKHATECLQNGDDWRVLFRKTEALLREVRYKMEPWLAGEDKSLRDRIDAALSPKDTGES